MSDATWFVGIDFQRVFGDPSSPWRAPAYAAAASSARRLAAAYAGRTVLTRFVAPTEPQGAWEPYYEEFPWALVGDADPLYELTDEVSDLTATVVSAPTFGKWDVLRPVVGDHPHLVVAGVATDCCVISTVLAAADAGASVTVVTDACAGSDDANHSKALDLMALYRPLVRLATTDEVLAEAT
ncbi:isochorismatase family protein [Pedococcus sp. KACC 23699]|uniref:Isochorismatase family protein n=1 Tax=Pedococcus sp. KACC 23699 TaxID=3149228 RepID=A0AAU7JXU5_9MICO